MCVTQREREREREGGGREGKRERVTELALKSSGQLIFRPRIHHHYHRRRRRCHNVLLFIRLLPSSFPFIIVIFVF